MRSQANRGRDFETLLNMTNSMYQKNGLACVHKVPTEFLPLRDARGKIVGCKVEHKSCVDYLGRYRGNPVAVEAKHTEQGRIQFDRVEPHQAAYMDDFCMAPGAVGLVVVSFGLRRFYAVPWPFWKVARDVWLSGRKRGVSVSVGSHGMFWDTPETASATPEQMLPEWEVKPETRLFLPYLRIIDKMDWRMAT